MLQSEIKAAVENAYSEGRLENESLPSLQTISANHELVEI